MATVSFIVRITRRLKHGWVLVPGFMGRQLPALFAAALSRRPGHFFSQVWLFKTMPVEPPSPALGANLALLVGLQLDRSYAVSMLVE
jgi:hypothetical protein